MKAKEMFEEIDYELRKYTEETILYRAYGDIFIEFDIANGSVNVYELVNTFIGEKAKVPISLTASELIAINQQMKELGWL